MTGSRRTQIADVLGWLPTAAVSRVVGRLCRLPVARPLRAPLWRLLAGQLGVDLSEAAEDPDAWRSFDAFFTRRLRADVRPFEGGPNGLSSPADGRLTALGAVADAEALPVKGRSDLLAGWLGHHATLPWAEPWAAVVYLSPRDYHRVHSPVAGRLVRLTYSPGLLIPVNPALVGDGSAVFGRNERLTFWLETASGPLAVALIGALCVGGIEAALHPLRTNRSAWRRPADLDLTTTRLDLEAGDDLAAFHMGSTVVLAWDGSRFTPDPRRHPGEPIRMGQKLGEWHT